jgi:hypothetical protein
MLKALLADGLAIPATDAAAGVFLGVAKGRPYKSATGLATGLTGATTDVIDAFISGRFQFAIASAAQTDIGKVAYIVDDNTVITSTSTHSIPCGIVTRYISSTLVEVDITGFVGLTHLTVTAIGVGAVKMVLAKGVFATTGTTKTISTAGLTAVDYGFVNYDGTVALDATKDWPLYPAGAQTVTVGSGNVTVTRTSGGSSGAGFFVLLFGS